MATYGAQQIGNLFFGEFITEFETVSIATNNTTTTNANNNINTHHSTLTPQRSNKPSTGIQCSCGGNMIQTSYEAVYGSNCEHVCSQCHQWMVGHSSIFHCYTHDLWSHPNGYTLCAACVEPTSQSHTKLPHDHSHRGNNLHRQKVNQIQQENNLLLNEIEQKLQSKHEQLEHAQPVKRGTSTKPALTIKRSKSTSSMCSDMVHAAAMRANTENPDFLAMFKNGWMYKRGGYHTAWKERYFELNGVFKTLTYYVANPKCTGCKYSRHGQIDFKQTPILRMMKSKKVDEFHVVTTKREWVFKCKDAMQRNEWYEAIKRLCARKKKKITK